MVKSAESGKALQSECFLVSFLLMIILTFLSGQLFLIEQGPNAVLYLTHGGILAVELWGRDDMNTTPVCSVIFNYLVIDKQSTQGETVESLIEAIKIKMNNAF